ncbi:MAG TPA: nucleotidyl transferase AbiEii/AbiGii toxin family protein [Planctomycetota bacterium]|nr:nucleotidyl transferase AbiEii/AbiGii toxin family protein [Planctomycetota bacterium]
MSTYTYITPTIRCDDPRMQRAIDGWLGLYEACYVMARDFSETSKVAEDESPYAMQSAQRPQPGDLIAALLHGASALNEWNGAWVLGGGLAINFYGRERATRDVDFFIFSDTKALDDLFARLAAKDLRHHSIERPSFMPPDALWWWVPLQYGLPNAAPVDVDLLVASHELMAFIHATGREAKLQDTRIRLIGPEALLVLKLQAYRGRDQEDAEQILRLQPALDRELLMAWVTKYKLESRLAEIETRIKQNPSRRG